MKTIILIFVFSVLSIVSYGQSTVDEFLALFPKSELPYAPPEEFPDFDRDYSGDFPKAFTDQALRIETVKKYLDEYDEGQFNRYPVHQLDLGKYIGLVVFSPTYNRMDGTFMPFYYLYLMDKNKEAMPVVMELSTKYFRASMADLDVSESSGMKAKIFRSEYENSKIVLEIDGSFTRSKSGEFGQRLSESSITYFVLQEDGSWKNVTDRLD